MTDKILSDLQRFSKDEIVPLEDVLRSAGFTEAEKCSSCGSYLKIKHEDRGGKVEECAYCESCGDLETA